MNRELFLAAGAIAALAALVPPTAQAETFNSALQARAFEAAERGPDALRSFVSRTRMIYGLNYLDYARAIPASTVDVAAGQGDAGFDLLPLPDELAAPLPTSPEQRIADETREQILRDLSHE
jgi:hypothetical protein